ncbi:MAG: alternative complex III monoheme cytochrome c lipoprotein ActE [Bacteroidetes bacterium HLUCCA01]|nr:MAG: alternative complex III monoheme cytochrome c lipoprotein ActE [Bacteroidetes bacterium HLUCCA01]
MFSKNNLLFASLVVLVVGCQGMPSEKPPVHPNQNMDNQERFGSQDANPFFADNRSDRLPVEGTVARGQLAVDMQYHQGINDDGSFVGTIPAAVSREMVQRGKIRYDIYCQPCHGGTGDGDGIVIGYGYVPPPSFYEDRIREMPDGEIYSSIYNGVRSMPSYRHQIPVEDRWAIVAYIRALQRSRNATEEDLRQLGLTPESVALKSGTQSSSTSAATP